MLVLWETGARLRSANPFSKKTTDGQNMSLDDSYRKSDDHRIETGITLKG